MTQLAPGETVTVTDDCNFDNCKMSQYLIVDCILLMHRRDRRNKMGRMLARYNDALPCIPQLLNWTFDGHSRRGTPDPPRPPPYPIISQSSRFDALPRGGHGRRQRRRRSRFPERFYGASTSTFPSSHLVAHWPQHLIRCRLLIDPLLPTRVIVHKP